MQIIQPCCSEYSFNRQNYRVKDRVWGKNDTVMIKFQEKRTKFTLLYWDIRLVFNIINQKTRKITFIIPHVFKD